MLKRTLLFLVCALFAFPSLFADGLPTPLMEVIESGKTPHEIRQLVASGHNPNDMQCEFLRVCKPVLRFALDRKDEQNAKEIIAILIQKGANVNALTYNRIEDERFFGFMPLLSYAALYASPQVVQLLINAGADVTYKPNFGCKKSALELAREVGRKDVAKILIKATKQVHK